MSYRFMRIKEVEAIVGMTRPGIYKAMKTAGFPQAVKVGSRNVRWRSDEIDKWMNNRERITQTGQYKTAVAG